MTETRPKIADSLASAGRSDLVSLDRHGQVRKRWVWRSIVWGYWGFLSALVGVEAWLSYDLYGWPGFGIAAVLGAWVAWLGSRAVTLRRAVRLVAGREFREAEALARTLTTGALVPRRLRASAFSLMSSAAAMLGEPDRALEHCRESIRLWRGSRRPQARASRIAEILLLTRLGRTDEARQRLAGFGGVPAGDYLRLHYYTAELYLAFTEGRCTLTESELHQRASFGLAITVATPLLSLLAWAFEQAGDTEMRELLRTEALDRHAAEDLRVTMPEVHRWLEAASSPAVRVADVEAEEQLVSTAESAKVRGA